MCRGRDDVMCVEVDGRCGYEEVGRCEVRRGCRSCWQQEFTCIVSIPMVSSHSVPIWP